MLSSAASVLHLRVTQIVNPAKASLDITVSVAGLAGGTSLIGRVSLFPPDQPAAFRLRVPAAAAEALMGRARATVVVELSTDKGELPNGLSVTFDSPTFSA